MCVSVQLQVNQENVLSYSGVYAYICMYICVYKYIKQCLQVTCSNKKLSQKYGHGNVELTQESYSVFTSSSF